MRALRGHGSLSVADHKEAPTRCNSWIYMCHHWSTYVCIPSRSNGKASASLLFLNLWWKCQTFPLLWNLMRLQTEERYLVIFIQYLVQCMWKSIERFVMYQNLIVWLFIQCGFKSMSVIPFKKYEMVTYDTDVEMRVLMMLARKRWLGHNLCRACLFYCHLHPSATASYGLLTE